MKPYISLFIYLLSLSLLSAQSFSDFIHIDQFGYRNNDQKIAVISDPQTGFNSGMSFAPGTTYEVRTVAGNTAIYTGSITPWNSGTTDTQSGDKAWRFDFSSVSASGDYYVYDVMNNVKSYHFTIGEDIYVDVLKQASRAFFYQRCGIDKPTPSANSNWADGICHLGAAQDLNCRSITDQNNPATAKDLSGGWHDAGDYNKYVNFTLNPVHDLLAAYEENPAVFGDNFNIPESGNSIPDILDEIKWELDWLLKMQLADGSALMKVAVTQFQVASPPSADGASRYYGEAQSSATRTICSIFAHAAIVYQSVGMNTYANLLQTKAELAWTWLQNNPGHSGYANTGFSSANPEVSGYDQDATSFTAAVYLFELTNQAVYKNYVDTHYLDIHAIQWTFWYPFESVYQNALLYYAGSNNGSSGVQTDIINNFRTSTQSNNGEMLPAYLADSSPYRAFISTDNYTWGSNQVKASTASIYYDMVLAQIDPPNDEHYLKAAENYLHYLHGVNPMNLVFLSNMNTFGAEKSCDEIYHGWFADGTNFDNATTSLYGPAPGFVPGGANRYFSPPAAYQITPPENQPAAKSYKDWNTTYPENSWEITEPANGYQGAYVKMISKFAVPSNPLPVDILIPLNASLTPYQDVKLHWKSGFEFNNNGFEVQRSSNGYEFESIGFVPAKTSNAANHYYEVIDQDPLPKSYYRYKQIDHDGHFTYSQIVAISLITDQFKITPNFISTDILNGSFSLTQSNDCHLIIYDPNGNTISSIDLGFLTQGDHSFSKNISLSAGIYFATIKSGNFMHKIQKIAIE